MDIPQALVESLQKGQVVLFVGADLPRALTGLPSRADLARDLARRHDLGGSLSLAQVTQRVGQAGNRWTFTAFLRDALDTAGHSPAPFHRGVVDWAKRGWIETLITTAYDNLLALAFQEAGLGINRIVRGSDVSFIDRERPTLVKLYGDIQQPDTLVVTEDDHYGLWRDRDKEDLLEEVRAALRKHVVLFVGYNLADPDFNLLWREMLDRADRFTLGAYAVWPGLATDEVNVWRDRGIRILDAYPWDVSGGLTGQTPSPDRSEAEVEMGETTAINKEPEWDTRAVRELLSAAFSDGELTTLCFDYFRPVYEDFSSGMSKSDKIQRLLEYCEKKVKVQELMDVVRERNPAQYRRFASRLRW